MPNFVPLDEDLRLRNSAPLQGDWRLVDAFAGRSLVTAWLAPSGRELVAPTNSRHWAGMVTGQL